MCDFQGKSECDRPNDVLHVFHVILTAKTEFSPNNFAIASKCRFVEIFWVHRIILQTNQKHDEKS